MFMVSKYPDAPFYFQSNLLGATLGCIFPLYILTLAFSN